MRSSLVALVVAITIGAITGASYAQDNPKAAAAPPPGVHKKMPLADSVEAKAVEPGSAGGGLAKGGKDSLMAPGTITQAKPFK